MKKNSRTSIILTSFILSCFLMLSGYSCGEGHGRRRHIEITYTGVYRSLGDYDRGTYDHLGQNYPSVNWYLEEPYLNLTKEQRHLLISLRSEMEEKFKAFWQKEEKAYIEKEVFSSGNIPVEEWQQFHDENVALKLELIKRIRSALTEEQIKFLDERYGPYYEFQRE